MTSYAGPRPVSTLAFVGFTFAAAHLAAALPPPAAAWPAFTPPVASEPGAPACSDYDDTDYHACFLPGKPPSFRLGWGDAAGDWVFQPSALGHDRFTFNQTVTHGTPAALYLAQSGDTGCVVRRIDPATGHVLWTAVAPTAAPAAPIAACEVGASAPAGTAPLAVFGSIVSGGAQFESLYDPSTGALLASAPVVWRTP
jgi:hypothetical protein